MENEVKETKEDQTEKANSAVVEVKYDDVKAGVKEKFNKFISENKDLKNATELEKHAAWKQAKALLKEASEKDSVVINGMEENPVEAKALLKNQLDKIIAGEIKNDELKEDDIAYLNSDEFNEEEFIDTIAAASEEEIAALEGTESTVYKIVTSGWKAMTPLLMNASDSLREFLTTSITEIVTGATPDNIDETVTDIIDKISIKVDEAVDSFLSQEEAPGFVHKVVDKVLDVVGDLVEGAVEYVKEDLPEDLGGLAHKMGGLFDNLFGGDDDETPELEVAGEPATEATEA